jgi:ATP-dependent Clp protease ATP-binding subunit ClpA
MFERFTVPSRDVIIRATGEAKALGNPKVGTGHLLLALTDDGAGPAAEALRAAGVDHGRIRAELVRRAPALFDAEDAAALRSVGIDLDAVMTRIRESFGPKATGRAPARRGSPRLNDAAKAALTQALRAASGRHDKYLGPEHLLVGLLADADNDAVAVLTDAGVDRDRLREDLLAALPKSV